MNIEQFTALIKKYHTGVQIIRIATRPMVQWEMDNYIALLRHGKTGKPFIVTTDHGRLVTMSYSQLKTATRIVANQLNSMLGLADVMDAFTAADGDWSEINSLLGLTTTD